MKKKVLFAIVIILCLIIAITYLFIPIKAKESITLPAIIICGGGENLQVENTNLTIDGTWTRSIVTSPHQSFAGKIQVEMLDYTLKEDGWDLNFQVTDEASTNYVSGGFFYNSNSDLPGYGWLYTDKDHDYYVLVTTHFNNHQSDDYIVIAPAETEEEAKHICNMMGLNYLQN